MSDAEDSDGIDEGVVDTDVVDVWIGRNDESEGCWWSAPNIE